MTTSPEFVFDSLIEADNFCNYSSEIESLLKSCLEGRRRVVMGRRNFGKTSMVKNIVAERFRAAVKASKKPRALVMYANLLGVKAMSEVDREIRVAFEHAFAAAFPVQEAMQTLTSFFKGLRPTASIDALSGSPTFSLASANGTNEIPFFELIHRLARLAKEEAASPLLILDEFQDIHFVPQGEAKMREALESLTQRCPVIVLGSKKHLLARIFGHPDAPLAGWGEDLEIGAIDPETYRRYANKRLNRFGLTLSSDVSNFLQATVDHVPEAMNMIGAKLIELYGSSTPIGAKSTTKDLNETDVGKAVIAWLEARSGRYEEYLAHFTTNEAAILRAFATNRRTQSIQGKAFLSSPPLAKVSASSVAKTARRFEDDAVIYRDAEGYFLSDPLLAEYLRRYR